MKYLLLIFISMGVYAQKNGTEAKIRLLAPAKQSAKTIYRQRRPKNNSFQILKENNKKLRKLLEKRSNTPLIWDGEQKILTGKAFRGKLLNSIVSTNLESPVLVKAFEGQGLPYNAKFSCKGTTKHKRVITYCDKLVTDSKEISISAQILNIDGTAGLQGEYDDGKEELIAGALASNLAQGVLSAAETRVNTTFGSVSENTLKNKAIGGLITSAKTASDIMLEEMKTKEPIVSINAGKEVLVYFMEAADVN